LYYHNDLAPDFWSPHTPTSSSSLPSYASSPLSSPPPFNHTQWVEDSEAVAPDETSSDGGELIVSTLTDEELDDRIRHLEDNVAHFRAITESMRARLRELLEDD
jgi:hypothetical protein